MFLRVLGMMPGMDLHAARKRLGDFVALERAARGMSKEEAARRGGIDSLTWSRVEAGKGVRDTTYAAIEDAIKWKHGSCNRVLAGGDPEPVEPEIAERHVDGATLRGPADAIGDPTLLSLAEEVLEEALRLARSRHQRREGGPNG